MTKQNITKKELAYALAKKEGLSKKQAKQIVDDLFEMMEDYLIRGETIKIRNFGSFAPLERKERRFKNPKTNEIKNVPQRKYPVFTPSTILKEKVRDI